MNTIDCFSEIKTKAKDLVPFLEDLTKFEKIPWQEHFGFKAIPIDTRWIGKESALDKIHKVHPIKQLGLLKVPKKSFYNWHVDDFRQSCINLLVSKDHHSYSVFGEHQNDYYHNNIIELNYKPLTYYLFNNQRKHAVINLDSKDRYLFSLYFEEETPYEVLQEKLKSDLVI